LALFQLLPGILAFVDILVDSKQLDSAIASLKQLPNLKEVYQVVGGGCNVVSLVAAADIEEFRDILKNKIQKIKGVKETIASLSLATYKKETIPSEIPNL
jgi:DNA-binding Lrp family transcriptional regulator